MRGLGRRLGRAGVLAAACLGAAPALADEAWHNDAVEVTWQAEDVGGHAVFRYAVTGEPAGPMGAAGQLFIEGLKGSDQNRGTYWGVWSADAATAPRCPLPLTTPDGRQSWHWGHIVLTFDRPDYPSGWHAKLSTCDAPSDRIWSVAPD